MNHRMMLALWTILVVQTSAQTTWLVPSQHPTIQAAIAAPGTVNGDDVLVAPGVYSESINFLGKAIEVHSSGGAAVTTIMGTAAGRVVTLATGEGPASVLDGFTVTAGDGGIFCQDTAPTIENCVITGNAAGSNGGGIRCLFTGTGLAAPTIQNCTITNNITFAYNQFAVTAGGGGLHFESLSGSPAAATIDNCIISSNITTFSRGGGIMAKGNWTLTVTGCGIEQNWSASEGGGIYSSGATVSVTSCRVTANESAGGAGGGGVYSTGGLTLVGCSINGNHNTSYGAVSIQGGIVRNCTVIGNFTGGLGYVGGIYGSTIISSIVWGNEGLDLYAPSSVTYSDIGSGIYTAGVGTISIDPLFANPAGGDFRLSTTSPCRDAGSPGAVGLPATDLDGSPRIVGGIVDMGADEIPVLTYLGTADGLDLYATINGAGDPLASTRAGVAGDLLTVRMVSSSGALAGGLPLFAARLYPTSAPFMTPPGFPAIWLDGAAVVAYGALSAPPFGFPGLPPAGLVFSFTVPLGLAGTTVRMQGLVSSINALNGSYATTNATEVTF